MHAMPLANSELRQLFQVEDVVAISTGQQPVSDFGHSLSQARRSMRQSKGKVTAIVFIAVDSTNDMLCLYRAGNRGGHKKLWTFGPITRQTKLL